MHRFFLPILIAGALATGCSGETETHPWLTLPEESGHRIVEFSGRDGGQIVVALGPESTPEGALELGRRIQEQAPDGITLNALLYSDEYTAENWRTVPADLTLRNLWVTVVSVPQTGRDEVRWVRAEPESPYDSIPATSDSLPVTVSTGDHDGEMTQPPVS